MHVWVVEKKDNARDWHAFATFLTKVSAADEARMERSWCPRYEDGRKYRIRKYVPAQKDGQA